MTLVIRHLAAGDLHRLAEIDRTETINAAYRQHGELLEEIAVEWRAFPWDPQDDHEHSVARQIAGCREHMEAGGQLLGAFVSTEEGEQLAGLGIMTPEVRPGVAQLAFLHVSQAFRGQGVGRALAAELERLARESGATEYVVSATPTKRTVDFYLALGFRPDAHPLPELLALEPEDVHLRKKLS